MAFEADEDAPEATATAEESGAANEFFTRENSEDTSVYDDSCSSSSENGLKLVRLVTSSTTLVELLLDLRGTLLLAAGEVGGIMGDSMSPSVYEDRVIYILITKSIRDKLEADCKKHRRMIDRSLSDGLCTRLG